MKILLVSSDYPPEIRSASHLMQDLATELRDRGHAVTVATCYPKYNLSESPSSFNFEEVSHEDGIRVIRIHTLPHHKVNFILRGISQLTLPYIFWQKLKHHLKAGIDAVVVYSPPLPLWKIGYKVNKTFGAKFILNVQDLFPQNAIDLGALHNPILVRLFENMEKAAYHHADVITVHSKSNKEFLTTRKGVASEKLVSLHNWVEIGTANQSTQNGDFRKRLSLEDKFIFFFGGVIGPSQGLDLIIHAAKTLQSIRDLTILLVGDGTEKEQLQRLAEDYHLQNVVFHPFISKKDYRALLKEVDVGLVCLTAKNKTPVVPGKILDYMAASVPVLALLNKESDAHDIIREAHCGYTEVSDDTEKAANLFVKMYEERAGIQAMGKNGYDYAIKHFSKTVCVDQLEKLMQR
jgi:glycosyltransferase involved in cell wall biosynthesis